MDKLKALLLHTDPEVREGLRRRLAGAEYVQILGETVTAFEAMEMLEYVPYGAIFLGVDLPGGVSGFEMAQMLASRKVRPALIFLADDESRAYKAFDLEALDYLIWPVEESRFERTLERLRQFRQGFREPARMEWEAEPPDGEEEDEKTVQLPLGEEEEERFLSALRSAWDAQRSGQTMEIEKLAINLEGKMVLVPFDQIIFVEAYEDYSYVHTAQSKYLTSYRLKNLEKRLMPHRFFRVHRKYLVNLDMVTEIASLPGSNFMLRTAGRTRIELPVSRRRIAELKQILGL